MIRHIRQLTRTIRVNGQRMAVVGVYMRRSGDGWTFDDADDTGYEGVACVDDVARAALLATLAYERTGDEKQADLAQRWLSFIHYMQLEDGRFTNFILDRAGRRNLDGRTSYPGGAWWTVRALGALAAAYRVFGDARALAALARCPLPAPEYPEELKTRSVLALAGMEILRSDAPHALRALWRRRVRRWCDRLVDAAGQAAYVPDVAGEAGVGMWGYHQLHALASAATILREPRYLAVAERTAWNLARPVLAGRFYYTYPNDRTNQCAYCISPLVQGLTALYRATGVARYRTLALQAAEWFAGANDAGQAMYDVESGRCWDGLTAQVVSANCGAESAIEAGFADLERRWLLAAQPQRRPEQLVS